jgi:hypothetical protein
MKMKKEIKNLKYLAPDISVISMDGASSMLTGSVDSQSMQEQHFTDEDKEGGEIDL